ncbi:MAG: GntP family permease [Holosporaceae bacterium]|jgi:H+/gluconate symporter-like permease|nr:GntP family permease [Holosporaceae bacterium]
MSILLSMALLIFLAYRGFSILVLAPFLASLAVFLSGNESLLAHYTQIFMVKLGDFATVYFPLFLLSAIFGKIMENSGSARSIAEYVSRKIGAENAILSIVLSCAVLTYGGVSLFVVAFAVYPIAVAVFRESNTPKRLIPGAIALGSFTFTMVALPGTPAIQNAIPAQYFGTDTFAAPVIGIVASIVMFVLGMFWMKYQLRIARENNEGYGNHEDKILSIPPRDLPNFWIAVIPIVLVILINYISIKFVLPQMDTAYLREEKYGTIDISTVTGNWAIIVGVFFSIVFLIACHFRKIDITKCLNQGATDSLTPIFNTASVVGYGAVINSLPGFALMRDYILSMSPENPLISGSCVTGLLGAVTGSASGGMSISLEMMGAKLFAAAGAQGLDPEILHRIIALSSSTLHALPHNGAIITLLVICGLTHRDSYRDIFMVSLVSTTIATVVALLITMLS